LAVLGAAVAAVGVGVAVPASAGAAAPTTFRRINLVSDQPGHAQITDPNLVNAWGMSHGPNTPLWVSDNGADVSTLYRGATPGTAVSPVPLVVSVPGGAPTGQVFNDTSGFEVPGTGQPALFMFATETGVISAWNQAVPTATSAVKVASVHNAVFKGLALVHSQFGPLLLATDFHHNRVDVFNSHFRLLHVARLFHDKRLPAHYAPFNVAQIRDHVFITYARQDADRHDDVAGAGHGFIDEYTRYGALIRRFAGRGALDSPWGMVVAPATFGSFAGRLLVGNFGNGRIHAYSLRSGREVGTLQNGRHHPIVIDGLWGLIRGDATAGGADSVWFSAGPDNEAHGLLGLLQPR
jgi:uncharacterized protein (TIGR03118 family)